VPMASTAVKHLSCISSSDTMQYSFASQDLAKVVGLLDGRDEC